MEKPLGSDVLSACIKQLEQLEEKERNRVLASLSTYFNGPPITTPARPGAPGSRGVKRGE